MAPGALLGGVGAARAALGARLLCASSLPSCEKLPHSLLPPLPLPPHSGPEPSVFTEFGVHPGLSPPWDSAGAAFGSGPLCSEGGKHPGVPGRQILLKTQEGSRSSGDPLRPKTSWWSVKPHVPPGLQQNTPAAAQAAVQGQQTPAARRQQGTPSPRRS